MRHVWSLIAGIVVTPLAWGLLAMGQTGATATVEAWAKANHFDTGDLIKPAVYLAAAGILLGLIATLRISPLGSLIAAVAYLGVNVGIFINPFATRDAIPNDWSVRGQAIPLHAPMLNGSLLVVGVLLLIAVGSPGRWRTAAPATAAPEAPAAPTQPSAAEATEVTAGEPATSGFGSAESTATAPLPRAGSHDAQGAGPVGEPADQPSGGNAEAGEARTESGDSPWSAPPRGTDRPE